MTATIPLSFSARGAAFNLGQELAAYRDRNVVVRAAPATSGAAALVAMLAAFKASRSV